MASAPYVLSVEGTLSTAWKKVKGTKGSVWAAIGITFLFGIGFFILEKVTKAVFPHLEPVVYCIGQLITTLMQIGIFYIGIKRAFDLPFSWDMVFRVFDLRVALHLIIVYLLQALCLLPIGFIFIAGIAVPASQISGAGFISAILFVLGFIGAVFIMIRLHLATGFVLDKELHGWKALTLSFSATRGNFWQLLLIMIFQMIVLILSVFPLLGIGFIWSYPFVAILFGEVYKRLLANVEVI